MSANSPIDLSATSTHELLERVGMLDSEGNPHRSNPLSSPAAFKELTSRLAAAVGTSYDIIVVRDLFGDRVLGYQLSLITDIPVAVSYDQEGIIVLEDKSAVEPGNVALIAADTHFTAQSIQAAASGVEQAGMAVAGAAIFLQTIRGEYSFPVWILEQREQRFPSS
jgi:hypothetical protein